LFFSTLFHKTKRFAAAKEEKKKAIMSKPFKEEHPLGE
jgi:hypothetical protein